MSVWQPIATWPTTRADPAYFWVVPKTADEAYVDSAGRPIVSTAAPRLFLGRYHTWSAREKATHWMEAPTPSRPEAGTAGGTMDLDDARRRIMEGSFSQKPDTNTLADVVLDLLTAIGILDNDMAGLRRRVAELELVNAEEDAGTHA